MTVQTFAKQLGFESAADRKYREIMKLAKAKGLLKIVQGGFMGDSMHHPKLVVLSKSFEAVGFLEKLVFPSYIDLREIDGYSLHLERTGMKRVLSNGEFSTNEWWHCEDCGKQIKIRQPYASKIDFSKRADKIGHVPIFCKCLPCFLDLIEEFHLADG